MLAYLDRRSQNTTFDWTINDSIILDSQAHEDGYDCCICATGHAYHMRTDFTFVIHEGTASSVKRLTYILLC